MTATHLNASVIAAGSVGLALGVRLVGWPLVRPVVTPVAPVEAEMVKVAQTPRPDSLATALVEADPFRVARRPARVAYDAVRQAQPLAPTPPKPALTLLGIVWDRGRDPTALIDGLPGVEGPRAVRRGETVGVLHVKTIAPDRVLVTGLDTVWTLTVREPWQ